MYKRQEDGTQIKILETTAEYYTKTGGDEAYRNYLLERLDKGKEIDWYSIFAEDVFRFTEEGRYLDLSDLKGCLLYTSRGNTRSHPEHDG